MIPILWLCSKPFWILLSRPNFVWQPEMLLAVYQLQSTIFPSEVNFFLLLGINFIKLSLINVFL